MINYYKARAIYRRNMLFGIGLCMYLYVTQSGRAYLLADDIDGWGHFFWPILLAGLYGVLAWIRSRKGKERPYDGRLRIIPKLFIGYLLFASVCLLVQNM